MKLSFYILCSFLLLGQALAKEPCPTGTKSFECVSPGGKAPVYRCATAESCYDRVEGSVTTRCCPAPENSAVSKTTLLAIITDPSDANLTKFKETCNDSSLIDLATDDPTINSIKAKLISPNEPLLRALIFAEAHCTNPSSGGQIQRWLGNDVLISFPEMLIQALSLENTPINKQKLATSDKDEWFGTQCADPKCETERKDYLQKKKEALQSLKNLKATQKAIQKELLKAF